MSLGESAMSCHVSNKVLGLGGERPGFYGIIKKEEMYLNVSMSCIEHARMSMCWEPAFMMNAI